MSFACDYSSMAQTRGAPEWAQKAIMVRPQEKNTQARGGMFGDDGCIFRVYSSFYRIDNNGTYVNRGGDL